MGEDSWVQRRVNKANLVTKRVSLLKIPTTYRRTYQKFRTRFWKRWINSSPEKRGPRGPSN